ncbi:MAG: hypothetical protein JWM68_3349 [Verrucomicrobiales bacterium]|nr:hypothetical protein [Verrucomicrobiales bacterium]
MHAKNLIVFFLAILFACTISAAEKKKSASRPAHVVLNKIEADLKGNGDYMRVQLTLTNAGNQTILVSGWSVFVLLQRAGYTDAKDGKWQCQSPKGFVDPPSREADYSIKLKPHQSLNYEATMTTLEAIGGQKVKEPATIHYHLKWDLNVCDLKQKRFWSMPVREEGSCVLKWK